MADARRAKIDEAVKGVMITAEPGRAFCAGGDIREVAALPLAEGKKFLQDEYTLMLELQELQRDMPVAAVANGFIIGAGAGLFMSCRTRIATESSFISMPECVLGTPALAHPAGSSPLCQIAMLAFWPA